MLERSGICIHHAKSKQRAKCQSQIIAEERRRRPLYFLVISEYQQLRKEQKCANVLALR